MNRTFLLIGSIAGLLGVAFGAFGAHSLRGALPADMLGVWETGARYQMYHALALLAVAALAGRSPSRAIAAAGWLFTAGIVLFSGSLYVLAVTQAGSLGAVTPFGGLAFIAGWACLAWAAIRSR